MLSSADNYSPFEKQFLTWLLGIREQTLKMGHQFHELLIMNCVLSDLASHRDKSA